MFGQIIVEESKEQTRNEIYNEIKPYGFENREITNAINNIKCVPRTHISASMKVLEAILSYIFSYKIITKTKVQFINMLNSYIDMHITEKINIADLCKYFSMERTHLYELSKSYLDCGLHQYILHKRILYAQKLLKETKISIMDLTERTGFSDYNYFSRVFRKKTGLSPRQYRNSVE
jgi:YesN/AraC family two-component response regulator